MKFLLELEARAVRWTRLVALIGALGLLFQSLATLADVTLRWGFNAPIAGLNDIIGLAVAIVLAACFPIVVAQRQNITIRFLAAAVGPRVARWLDAAGSLATLAFVSVIAWQLVVYTGELAASGRTTWLLRIPVTPYWAVATAVVLLCIPVQAIAFAADVARAVTGAPPAREIGMGESGDPDLAERV
jgi:TRAP-type C4-dicarboxylate transport system permease small subunit